MPKEKAHAHSIRFPQALYEQIKALADRDHRSFNAQVIYLLEKGILDCREPDTLQYRKDDAPQE